MAKLLTCPFCDSEPQLDQRQDESCWSHNIVTYYRIGCPSCEFYFESEDEDEIYEHWNMRIQHPETFDLMHKTAVALMDHFNKLKVEPTKDEEVFYNLARKALESYEKNKVYENEDS